MNKQKFIDYSWSPENLTEGALEDLKKILTHFPYFSIGRSIVAKASKDLNHSSKGIFTASAAIYATDRKHLKKYINGELMFRSNVPTVKDSAAPPPDEKKKNTPPPIVSKSISENDLFSENLKTPTGEEVDQLLDELQHDMNELKKSREHFVDIQNQIEEEEAFSAAIRKAAKKVGESEDKKITSKEESKPSSEYTPPVKPSSKTFLDYDHAETNTSIAKVSSSKKNRKSSDSKSSTRATKPASESAGTTKQRKKDDDESDGVSQLIDDFIKDSPSIKRQPNAGKTSDLSQKSSAWNPELASEYLAQIYLEQGNPARTISIYEALSLKFPEKKSYFAGLIHEIKK